MDSNMSKEGRTMKKKTWIAGTGLLALLISFSQAQITSTGDQRPPEVIALKMLPKETGQMIQFKKAVEAEIDGYSTRLYEMNDWLYHNPESGFQEVKASKMLGDELKMHGFDVKYGVDGLDEEFNRFVEERYKGAGLKTAFVAKYKGIDAHPVICFMLEADALRSDQGPFHGCQHNQQGPVAVCSAIALSKVMEKNKIGGSVWVIHTPAEEIPPSTKSFMTRAGFFDGVDFLIRSHGTPAKATRAKAGLGNCCMLIESTLYEFRGKPSHGTRAWEGRDALDAARLFFAAVDMLREHSEPNFRFMGTITKVGDAPNVTNDYVQIDHWIRNADRTGLEAIRKKQEQVDTIAKGAAMATFTDVKIRHYNSDYNGIESAWLQAIAWQYTNEYGDPSAISEDLGDPTGWDESGIGALNVPGIHIKPAVSNVPEVAGHSYENAALTVSPEGHKGLLLTSKIGTAVGLRLLMDLTLQKKIKEEFVQWQNYGLKQGLITKEMLRKTDKP
jgi:amidohydrolase